MNRKLARLAVGLVLVLALSGAKRGPVTLPVIYAVWVPMVIGGSNEAQ